MEQQLHVWRTVLYVFCSKCHSRLAVKKFWNKLNFDQASTS